MQNLLVCTKRSIMLRLAQGISITIMDDLTTFAEMLTIEKAFPILSQGYAKLVQEFAAHSELRSLAVEIGVHALIDSDNPLLNRLKKQNREFATQYEREAEAQMRKTVAAHFPDHMIIGEEHGV